jgi:hypothetical protein
MSRGPRIIVPERGEGGRAEGVQLGRVGLIAVIGFAIGVVWPRLAGVSLVPSAPVEGARQEVLAEQEATEAQSDGEGAAAEEPEPPTPGERLVIEEYKITSCRDADGKAIKDCGELDAEALLGPALRSLATCPAAENAIGKLSVGVDVDFKARRANDVKSGRSTDLPSAVVKGLLDCVRRSVDDLSWKGVEARHPSYTVYALVEFERPELVKSSSIVPASGSATVRWNVALIRREPNSTAKIRARLTSGTRVIVTARQEEWYRVKYDTKGGEGWVHGAAIGMDVSAPDGPDAEE